jgi:hypothetical protein
MPEIYIDTLLEAAEPSFDSKSALFTDMFVLLALPFASASLFVYCVPYTPPNTYYLFLSTKTWRPLVPTWPIPAAFFAFSAEAFE